MRSSVESHNGGTKHIKLRSQPAWVLKVSEQLDDVIVLDEQHLPFKVRYNSPRSPELLVSPTAARRGRDEPIFDGICVVAEDLDVREN